MAGNIIEDDAVNNTHAGLFFLSDAGRTKNLALIVCVILLYNGDVLWSNSDKF